MQQDITLFLCGDVMTGRGIDQIMPHSVDPVLYEPHVKDARRYIRMAWLRNGLFRKPVDYSYIWGQALPFMEKADLRIINLETSITTSDEYARKRIHYRMHPNNIPCLTAANINCCALANNHLLDWGRPGLVETLETLENAGIPFTGAGRTNIHAALPSILPIPGKGNVLVFSWGHPSSGIPSTWKAGADLPGLNYLESLGPEKVDEIARHTAQFKKQGDLLVASIHWGGNWGYEVPETHREFAHALIDKAGADIVYGHSSHHFMGIEVYRGKLILYGCGDFINDYEGIRNRKEYKGHLGFMYFPTCDPATGALKRLELVPTEIRKFRVNLARKKNRLWMADVLKREGAALGTSVQDTGDQHMLLRW
jgi:poly-gamma-glutamate synthesis protein (capsule biosynthesis protein)